MLGEQLLEAGLIDKDQLQIVLTEQKSIDKKLGRLLVEFGFLDENILRDHFVKSSGFKSIDLSEIHVNQSVLDKIPRNIAIRYKAVPIAFNKADHKLTVAIAEPHNLVAMDGIRRAAGDCRELELVLASEADIERALTELYGLGLTLEEILEKLESQHHYQQNQNNDSSGEGIVQIVHYFLGNAIQGGASDIHFEPEALYLRVRYRIDGVLTQACCIHKNHWPAIAVRLKVLGGMDIAETRSPQDGSFSFSVHGHRADFRVSSFPVIHGENIVLRIFTRNKSVMGLSQLGLDKATVALLQDILKIPDGIVLVAGPTGSGKTTTLYSLINELNDSSVNIMTLEDPVEYTLQRVRQSSVKPSQKFSYSDGIRAILRQDPDIVLIGEIRDADTAKIAIRAAMTGHKVFSTVHTKTAMSAIQRLVDLGVETRLLSGNLKAVIAQRLIRRLCRHCNNQSEQLRLQCSHCRQTGYQGRFAIAEVFRIESELEELIGEGASTQQMQQYALKLGWQPLENTARSHVKGGNTDAAELIRVLGC